MTIINRLIREEFSASKALVIAPKRVAELTWAQEAAKWDHLSGLRVAKVLGTAKQRIAALSSRADIYVINRENVIWLVDFLGKKWDFDILVIDELSSFKSSKAKRWRALKRVAATCDYVYGLTGTPAPNGYIDLWPEIYLLDRGSRLGRTLGEFRNTFFSPGAHRGHVVFDWRLKAGAKERIDHLLSDLCLSMSKEDWLELPERTFNNVYVSMDKKSRGLYEQFQRDRIVPLLDGKISALDEDYDSVVLAEQAATLTGKLLQMANGAVYDDTGSVFHIHDQKLDALEEIREACHGAPLLVFYSYKHDLDRILERFPDAEKLEGPDVKERWDRGEIPMLLCHPASAGHGLNMQYGGHIAVWFGLPWSLELYQQANDRLHRMGQEHGVIIHHIICQDTMDERVLAALQQKDATQKSLLDALKQYITEEGLN